MRGQLCVGTLPEGSGCNHHKAAKNQSSAVELLCRQPAFLRCPCARFCIKQAYAVAIATARRFPSPDNHIHNLSLERRRAGPHSGLAIVVRDSHRRLGVRGVPQIASGRVVGHVQGRAELRLAASLCTGKLASASHACGASEAEGGGVAYLEKRHVRVQVVQEIGPERRARRNGLLKEYR